jgi:hypothetical protein
VVELQNTSSPADSDRVKLAVATLQAELDALGAGEPDLLAGGRGGRGALTISRGARASGATLTSRKPVAPSASDFERIDEYLRAYLEGEWFKADHPLAYGRWLVGWEMLWCADTKAKVIALVHRATDAIQAFTASLLEQSPPLAIDPQWPDLLAAGAPRPQALADLTNFAESYRAQLGDERCELLRALIDQWQVLAEALRTHEDGAREACGRLRWEDGRRLVLLTALVMVEVHRSFA